ncbi:MAG TPA: sigma-54 dependent transcriptional regulator [Bryobacteraceae bacterium]
MEPVSELPILLVDDEPQVLRSASVALHTSGFPHVVTIDDSRNLLPLLVQQPAGVIVLDLTMPHISGQALLARIAEDFPEIPIVVMTASNDLETAVQCMQTGATDYLVKPVDQGRLMSSVRRALELRALNAELLSLKDRLLTETPHKSEAFAEIVTQDRAMFAIFRYLEAIAPSPQPVLITGETGTGKELVARALHRLSRRAGELIAVNVAGLDDNLFSDALFGHAKGAYTGADRPREGLVAAAAEGTLFLDEIGDLTTLSQVKLLRLLQDGTFYPLGTDRPRQSSVRIIVATNCDVAKDAASGRFRKDLYYRLRTHHLQLPALRNRTDDLPLLVNHFVEKAARVLAREAPTVPHALYAMLKTYDFPGNIRELEAMTFDAVARCRGTVLPLQSFREVISGGPLIVMDDPPPESPPPFGAFPRDRLPTLEAAEEALINEALARAAGNQGVAAGILGISRQALNKRLSRRRQADPFEKSFVDGE